MNSPKKIIRVLLLTIFSANAMQIINNNSFSRSQLDQLYPNADGAIQNHETREILYNLPLGLQKHFLNRLESWLKLKAELAGLTLSGGRNMKFHLRELLKGNDFLLGITKEVLYNRQMKTLIFSQKPNGTLKTIYSFKFDTNDINPINSFAYKIAAMPMETRISNSGSIVGLNLTTNESGIHKYDINTNDISPILLTNLLIDRFYYDEINKILCFNSDNFICVWDLENNFAKYSGSFDNSIKIKDLFYSDISQKVIITTDKDIKLLNMNTKALDTIKDAEVVTYNKNGKEMLVKRSDGAYLVWNLLDQEITPTSNIFTLPLFNYPQLIAYPWNKNYFAWSSLNKFYIFCKCPSDLTNKFFLIISLADSETINYISFIDEGTKFFIATQDKIFLYDFTEFAQIFSELDNLTVKQVVNILDYQNHSDACLSLELSSPLRQLINRAVNRTGTKAEE